LKNGEKEVKNSSDHQIVIYQNEKQHFFSRNERDQSDEQQDAKESS
jgi:hypothetical protein